MDDPWRDVIFSKIVQRFHFQITILELWCVSFITGQWARAENHVLI